MYLLDFIDKLKRLESRVGNVTVHIVDDDGRERHVGSFETDKSNGLLLIYTDSEYIIS